MVKLNDLVPKTIPVVINDFNLDINYFTSAVLSDAISQLSKSEEKGYALAYASVSNNTVGIATESVPLNATTSPSTISVNTRIDEARYSYLFFVRTNKNIESKIPLLKEKTFEKEVSPSFGSSQKVDEKDVKARIEYPDYIIVGMTDIQDGSYELMIRKIGNDEQTGKPIVQISVN